MKVSSNMSDEQKHFDVVVIGGGPAGMMAAGQAASLGAEVVIIDKNHNLGRKLLLTGKGRCNITQAEFNDREFIKKLGIKPKNAIVPQETIQKKGTGSIAGDVLHSGNAGSFEGM